MAHVVKGVNPSIGGSMRSNAKVSSEIKRFVHRNAAANSPFRFFYVLSLMLALSIQNVITDRLNIDAILQKS